jgi:hypothetical protein
VVIHEQVTHAGDEVVQVSPGQADQDDLGKRIANDAAEMLERDFRQQGSLDAIRIAWFWESDEQCPVRRRDVPVICVRMLGARSQNRRK